MDIIDSDTAARGMLARLATSLSGLAVKTAEEAKVAGDAGHRDEAWTLIGQSRAYVDAANRVLTIAREL